jgi:putative transposase
MRRAKTELYAHLIWATPGRAALAKPALERPLYRCMEDQARQLGCTVLAINGMPDHVHMVLRYPAKVAVSDLVKHIKGVSSHFAKDELHVGLGFHWQERYGAYSLSRSHVEKVVAYVKDQKRRHADNDLWGHWEETEEDVPEKG